MKSKLILLIIMLLCMICMPLLAFGAHRNPDYSANQTTSSSANDVQVMGEGISGDVPKQQSSSNTSSVPTKQKKQAIPSKVEYEKYDIESFKIYDKSTGKVLEVPVLDYVIGAVMTEIPATYQTEAIKSQAVAAHTYALHHHLTQQKTPDPALNGADFSADPSSHQGYMTVETAKERFGYKYDEYYKKISKAVEQVIDQILVYQDEPIVAAYHAISAGQTENAVNVWNGTADYLVPVDSKGDQYAPEYETIVAKTFDEIKQATEKTFPDTIFGDSQEQWLEVTQRSDSGYVTEIRVGDTTMTGLEFRNMLGLRSSNFSISFSGTGFAFVVVGYGHGVGMSQYGSDYMARQGADYIEILEHYYQNAQVVSVKVQE